MSTAVKSPKTGKTKTSGKSISHANRAEKSGGKPRAISDSERRKMIAEAAYYRAQHRGFHPDDRLNDWLEAETQVDEMISNL